MPGLRIEIRLDLNLPAAGQHDFQGTGRPTIPIQVSPGQLHRNQSIVRRLVVPAPNLCLTVLQAPPFEMTLQDAQGQTVTSAECCRP